MKKLFVFIFAFASFTGQAQSKFGIHAGVISSDINETYDGESDFSFKPKISYRAGVHAKFPLSTTISIMPQLNYVSKAGRIDEEESMDMGGFVYTMKATGNSKMNFLELPVHFVYNTQMANGNTFFFGLGPSFSYGLSGEGKIDITVNSNGTIEEFHESAEYKFDGKDTETANDDYAHYKAFELGLSMIAGYHFSPNFFVNLNFNQGLNNINPDKIDKGKTKTMYVGLGFGYYFNK